MLTVPTIIILTKAIAWAVAGLMGFLFLAHNRGARTGWAAADNRAALKAALRQREIARADAAGPRSRDDVVERLRDGKF